MSDGLNQTIFEQFIDIIERQAKKKGTCEFDVCDFNYRVRELCGYKVMDVLYISKDKCGRTRDVIVTIDITNICLEDLISCRWVDYLKKMAREFINDICPKKYIIIKEKIKKCRPEPARWEPLPCGAVTTVIRKKKPIINKPECKVIIEKECECVPLCIRKPCVPKQNIIIKYENEKPWKCGDVSILVKDPSKKKHDYGWIRGNRDYNTHIWGACCEKCEKNKSGCGC